MKSLSVFLKDLGSTVRNHKLLVSLIAILFIPVMYSGMFLTAFWDPYAKMSDLPVAVVNSDTGADYEGKTIQAGNDLIAELKKSDDFKWEFVSRAEADNGMASNHYYMTISIPEDFSSKATTVLDEEPQPAQIIYQPNEGYNFLASQIGGSAVNQIRSQVSAKVTEMYSEILFDQIKTVSTGFKDAGTGAGVIQDGAVQLDDGAILLKDNLAKLVEGTTKIQEGIQPLNLGTSDLQQGAAELENGSTALAGGLTQLQTAQKQLEDGSVQTHQGVSQLQKGLTSAEQGSAKLEAGLKQTVTGTSQLQDGLKSTVEGSAQLQDGLKSSEDGSATLAQSLKKATEGSQQVAAGAASVAKGIEQLVESNPELAESPEVQKLLAASQAVAEGSKELHSSEQQLAQGATALNQGQTQLLQGATKLHAGTQQLSEGAVALKQGAEQLSEGSTALHQGQQKLLQGANQIEEGQGQLADGLKLFGSKMGEAVSGSQQLAGGAGEIAAGTEKLAGGMNQLGDGVGTLADGSQKLNDGAGELETGLVKLKDGSGELASKLNDAADKTDKVKGTDATYNMFAEPVKVQEEKLNEVPNYGSGFAPYFLSLGLFVGALITTIVLPMRESSVPNASGFNRFISRTLSFAGVGLIQSLLAVIAVLYLLGLDVQNVPLFYLFTYITSLTFMFLVQAFVTWFDQPGRFIVIVILILQLTTSAGTFPVELIPGWMKVLNPWFPMTYSVSGYKAVISTGDFSTMWSQLGTLVIFGLVFLCATFIYFVRKSSNKSVELEPTVAV
ncbi:putative membrane protein [Paenibacillus sp. DS2015]|uniref:YhgE/Pip family protein n=1 Tax=Paenibacillus sp. DS2015 TaxID=3373917 RepID=UPI003D1D0492